MTTFDTLYLEFKTKNIQTTTADINKLQALLNDIEKKNKGRTEEEIKRDDLLKKRRKEQLDELREQQRQTDKLAESFQNMITGAVGAVTAYTSFGFLKAGLVDAQKLNTGIQLLGKQYNQSAVDIKAFGAALERSTGIPAQSYYTFFAAEAQEARDKRLPFNPLKLLRTLNADLSGPNAASALPGISQIPGASALIPWLQLPKEEFEKSINEGRGVAGNAADFQAAVDIEKSARKTSEEFSKIATQVDTAFSKSVEMFNEAVVKFDGIFSDHPTLAAAAGVTGSILGTLATGWATLKTAKWIRGLVTGGGAAAGLGEIAGGEAVTGVGIPVAIATAVAAGIAYWYAKKESHSPVSESSSPAGSSRKQQILDFWQAKGYTPGQAAGFAANAQAESGFGTHLLGYDGKHFGLYQWNRARRQKILDGTGIDVASANLDGQLAAAAWEANNMGFTPRNIPKDAYGAGAYISNKFEVPSTTSAGLAAEAVRRGSIAAGYGSVPLAGIAGGSGKTVNVKIDNIQIETQATDSKGIAREVGAELQNQIRMAMSNFDDGVNG